VKIFDDWDCLGCTVSKSKCNKTQCDGVCPFHFSSLLIAFRSNLSQLFPRNQEHCERRSIALVAWLEAHCVTLFFYKGFRHGLFAGMTPTVLKQCLNSLIRFGSMYEMTKWRRNQIQSQDPAVPLPTRDVFLLGAIAGALSAVVSHPIDTVKSNMQGNKEHIAKFKYSTWGCMKHIYATGGLVAFYSGLTPRLIRVTIEQATTFALFDRISRALDLSF